MKRIAEKSQATFNLVINSINLDLPQLEFFCVPGKHCVKQIKRCIPNLPENEPFLKIYK